MAEQLHTSLTSPSTMPSAGSRRGVKLTAAGLWGSGVMNHTLAVNCKVAVPAVKFGGARMVLWGCLSGVALGSLAALKRNLHTSPDCNILGSSVLPILWEQFGEGLFPAPV